MSTPFAGWSRRRVLRQLAVGAGAVPTLAPLGRAFLPNAHAASTGAPRRVVFIDVPLGLGGADGWIGSDQHFLDIPSHTPLHDSPDREVVPFTDPRVKLGTMLTPFAPLIGDLTVMQYLQCLWRENDTGSTHGQGAVLGLTGSGFKPNKDGTAQRASIDQYLASKVGKIVTPAFPSLNLAVSPTTATSFALDGTPVVGNQDPVAVYGQLFGGLANSGADAKADAARLARLARRKSVLDVVTADLSSFRKRLGTEDRARADAQLDAIRALERRLGDAITSPTAGASACARPARPMPIDVDDSANIPKLAGIMTDIVVAAFACDLTRIVAIQNYGSDYHHSQCNFDPINTKESYHSLSHATDAAGYAKFVALKKFFYGRAAELAMKLKQIPEAGGSMLDNTLIVAHAELGTNHTLDQLHHVTIGGKNLGVRNGRYMKWGGPEQGHGVNNLEHNRLLVSILNMMGLPDEQYGDEVEGNRGPLPGFPG